MDYKTNRPFDSRNDEDKEWQQRLREASLSMGSRFSKPGEIQRPGFERGPDYSLMTASNETQQPVSDAPASDGVQSDDAVQQAQQMLEQNIAQSSGVQSWQAQLDETLNQILNRKDFSYDLNGDALYQQYKDQYMLQGQQAMMDTMGQAAAMTGGYGNSYAQTVGQQAYNSHIQQLGNRIPELYSLALSKYQNEGDALLDRYSALLAERDFAEDQRRYDQEWEQKYGGSSGGSGGSGGYTGNPAPSPDAEEPVEEATEDPGKQESAPNYDTIAYNVNQYIKNGASDKEIKAYLNSAYRAGYITYEQYQSLLKGYRPVDFGE